MGHERDEWRGATNSLSLSPSVTLYSAFSHGHGPAEAISGVCGREPPRPRPPHPWWDRCSGLGVVLVEVAAEALVLVDGHGLASVNSRLPCASVHVRCV